MYEVKYVVLEDSALNIQLSIDTSLLQSDQQIIASVTEPSRVYVLPVYGPTSQPSHNAEYATKLHLAILVCSAIRSSQFLINSKCDIYVSDVSITPFAQDYNSKDDDYLNEVYWMAPKIIEDDNSTLNFKIDIWALGITSIEMIDTKTPLSNIDPNKVANLFLDNPPPLPVNPEQCSDELLDFIFKCLVKDPSKRASAMDLLDHPFIKKYEQVQTNILQPLILEYQRIISEKKKQKKKMKNKDWDVDEEMIQLLEMFEQEKEDLKEKKKQQENDQEKEKQKIKEQLTHQKSTDRIKVVSKPQVKIKIKTVGKVEQKLPVDLGKEEKIHSKENIKPPITHPKSEVHIPLKDNPKVEQQIPIKSKSKVNLKAKIVQQPLMMCLIPLLPLEFSHLNSSLNSSQSLPATNKAHEGFTYPLALSREKLLLLGLLKNSVCLLLMLDT
ncbi:MAG: putative serine/threonine-protein kinase 3 [Streblomastix strix]|uniref:Putative serine/threonine-protein kinase 3 n=1 Tax=Streblomastix strix TaxID=222440 RepID=A0A5J4X6B9_9EUKA|nr:MAG: putative serine/threonine-protein kinase 3 [Streblomastix strix]